MIELELPWPPSVNHYKSIGRLVRTPNGKLLQKRHTSMRAMRYYAEVCWEIMRRKANLKLSGVLSIEVVLYPPDKRRRDIDNGIKILLDALQKADVYLDDYQIARLLVTRAHIIPKGKVIVSIKALEGVL